MAVASFEVAINVHAPVEQVYAYLADLPRHVECNHQLQEMVALTEGPIQVGSQFKTAVSMSSNVPRMRKMMMAVVMPMMKMIYIFEGHTVAEITTLQPNKRIAWTAHMPDKQGNKLMQIHSELRLHPENGTTQVIQRCQMDPPEDSPLAKVVADDQAKQSQAEAATNLERLKSLIAGRRCKS